MKRVVYLVVPVLSLALALPAFAKGGGKPVTSSGGNDKTVNITVSGGVDLDWVYRDAELQEFQGLAGDAAEDTGTFEGIARIRLDAELSDNVAAALEFSNQRVDGAVAPNRWGANPEDTGVLISEANITLKDFLQEGWTWKAGVVSPSFNVRGTGGSPVFDPRRSAEFDTTNTPGANNVPRGKDELQPTGLTAHMDRENLSLDIWLLPAVDEGGRTEDDEAAYGVGLYYKLANWAEGSRLGALLLLVTDAGNEFAVFTLGGGVRFVGLGHENLELFGDVYLNFGDAGQTATDTIDAGGTMAQLGGRFLFQGDRKPWMEGKITYYSGDDDAADSDEGNFLSYENNSDLLVLEDQYFGMNVRSNYTALKVSGGASLSVGGGENNFDVSMILGITSTTEDVTIAGSSEDGLGNEVDFRGRYHLNSQTDLNVALGYLVGSDILEASTTEEEDTTYVFTMGLAVRF